MENIMDKEYPPRVLVKTWLDLIDSEYSSEIRKNLLKSNIERVFGSVHTAHMYVEQNNIYSYSPNQFGCCYFD